MVSFWHSRRKKGNGYRTPPPPDASLGKTVRDVEITASRQLSNAQARDSVVDAKRARLLKIRKDNALGPRFWEAVGEHRRA